MVFVETSHGDVRQALKLIKRKKNASKTVRKSSAFHETKSERKSRAKKRAARRGVVIGIETVHAMENGEPRRIAEVKAGNGDVLSAYIPRGVKGVEERSHVLIRVSRSPKVPGVQLRVKEWYGAINRNPDPYARANVVAWRNDLSPVPPIGREVGPTRQRARPHRIPSELEQVWSEPKKKSKQKSRTKQESSKQADQQ